MLESSRYTCRRERNSLPSRRIEMQIRRELGVILLAIRKADGRMVFNPPADAEIEGGDYLIAMGEPANLHKLEQILSEVGA